MDDVIPLSYIRIWARKNECAIECALKSGDRYRVDRNGVFINLPDVGWSGINTRQLFPVINFYPTLKASDLAGYQPGNAAYLHVVPADGRSDNRRASFAEIRQYVDQYFSLLGGLNALERYIAVRASEAGLVNVLQMRAALNDREKGETLGASVLRHEFCTWDKLLAACLDFERALTREKAAAAVSPFGFELSGEILVALGKVSRTQLEYALNRKRQGSKPLGEILIQMGACSKADIKACMEAQESLNAAVSSTADRIGELLVQHGRITTETLEEALHLQKLGRQPLHAVLLYLGACGKVTFTSFKRDIGLKDEAENYDDEEFANYLLRRGIINPKQLEDAQNIQNTGRQKLGELLVQLRKCSSEDVEMALNLQRHYRRLHPEAKREKLGDILIRRRLADAQTVDRAARAQAMGKEQLGTTLVNLGVCTRQDFADALEIQLSWREELKGQDDRLGQELVKNGFVEPSSLQRILQEQGQSNRPIGQILVEDNLCPPEAVIDTLLRRDDRRRKAFERFIGRVARGAKH